MCLIAIHLVTKKMKLIIAEFTSHAENWYQHLKSERRRKYEDIPLKLEKNLKVCSKI